MGTKLSGEKVSLFVVWQGLLITEDPIYPYVIFAFLFSSFTAF